MVTESKSSTLKGQITFLLCKWGVFFCQCITKMFGPVDRKNTLNKKSLNEWGYFSAMVLQSKVLVQWLNFHSVNKEITCSVTEFSLSEQGIYFAALTFGEYCLLKVTCYHYTPRLWRAECNSFDIVWVSMSCVCVSVCPSRYKRRTDWCMDLHFGMEVKWEDIQVRLIGQGQRSRSWHQIRFCSGNGYTID